MSVAVVPQVGQVAMLSSILGIVANALTFPLTIKLFSNNFTPSTTTEMADLTEVSGGGYADVEITDGVDFTISAGDPSEAVMDDFQDFNFTGAIGGSGIVYGWYLLDDNNVLIDCERFDSEITPINGSLIRVKPRFRLGNVS